MKKLIFTILFIIILIVVILVFLYLKRKTVSPSEKAVNTEILIEDNEEVMSVQAENNIQFSDRIIEKDKVRDELHKYLNINEGNYLFYVTTMVDGRDSQNKKASIKFSKSGRKIIVILLSTEKEILINNSSNNIHRFLKVEHQIGKPYEFTEKSKEDLINLGKDFA